MATEYRFLGASSTGYPREPALNIRVGKHGRLVTLPLTRDEALHTAVRLIELVQGAYLNDPPATEHTEAIRD